MSNPSKQKGTRAETNVVRYLASYGIKAERKALSGSADKGDVQVEGAYSLGLVTLEVKAGKQTHNPSRKMLEEWMRQARIEGENSGQPCMLVVARYHRSACDYDVWFRDRGETLHWYLDEWCDHFFGET